MELGVFVPDAKEYFKSRFYILKTAYEINNSNLAVLLDFKSGNSIMQMETGQLYPSVDALLRIVSLFAINIDWLFGRTDKIYNEDILEELEKVLFAVEVTPDVAFKDIDKQTRKYASDLEYRKREFTLAERANVVYLLQYLKVLTEKGIGVEIAKEIHRLNWSVKAIKDIVVGSMKAKRFKMASAEREYVIRRIFYVLANDFRMIYQDPSTPEVTKAWAKEQIKPLYDVEKVLYLQQVNNQKIETVDR